MYKGNPGEIDFGLSQREARVSEGLSYWESTVYEKWQKSRSLLSVATFSFLDMGRKRYPFSGNLI